MFSCAPICFFIYFVHIRYVKITVYNKHTNTTVIFRVKLRKKQTHLSIFVTTDTETLRLRSNSLQRSNLNTNQYHHPSHGSSRWSTNPSRSPSLTQEDIGLQRIVAEVKGLTYGISRVLREAHDGGSPGNSRSSVSAAHHFSFSNGLLTLAGISCQQTLICCVSISV